MSPYKRILLKLSGESLMGEQAYGIEPQMLHYYAQQIKMAVDHKIQLAVVIGGGNIFRGMDGEGSGIERVQGDYMGMLATCINGMALQSALEMKGVYTRLITAIEMRQIAEPYIRRRAIRHLEKGRVIIFAAGTGSPYFSTDTTAALRASEIGADCEIGPYCVIGPEVTLAPSVILHSHVVVAGRTAIGEATEVFPFASLGHRPQDLKFRGEPVELVIGARNSIQRMSGKNSISSTMKA